LRIIRGYRRFRSKKEKNELQQETVRDGKLGANPLHLPEEETKWTEVKCYQRCCWGFSPSGIRKCCWVSAIGRFEDRVVFIFQSQAVQERNLKFLSPEM